MNTPNKLSAVDKRSKEAERLTNLLELHKTFAFLRIGDMEMTALYGFQEGLEGEIDFGDGNLEGTRAIGNPGLDKDMIGALWSAYEEADYIDYCDILLVNRKLRPKLRLTQKSGATCNPTPETSYILPTWMYEQFGQFVDRLGKPVGIASAEAGVLSNLLELEEYREIAGSILPEQTSLLKTYSIRDRGRNLSKNLWKIKEDLADFVIRENISVLLLGLGGGAKIIGVQLAKELGIRVIDFGSLTRSLCYLGSDGNRSTRSTHQIFFFELPFRTVMEAQEKAFPDLKKEELLAKAHAQLILDLQRREIAKSTPWWELNYDKISRKRFKKSFVDYKNRYSPIFRANEDTMRERANFLHFCGVHKLTLEGILYYFIFRLKSAVAKIVRKIKQVNIMKA